MKRLLQSLAVGLFAFLLFGGQLRSQNTSEWTCGTTITQDSPIFASEMPEPSSNTWLEKYRTPGHWIPNDNTPIKTILVDWVICQKNDGSNAWQDIPTIHAGINRTFDSINAWYSEIHERSYELTCPSNGLQYIPDSRIRFELNKVLFIQDDSLNLTLNGHKIMDYLKDNDEDYGKVMYHVFARPIIPDGVAHGYFTTYNGESYVMSRNAMSDTSNVYHIGNVHHFTHEYGHSVGLHHTYDFEYTEIAFYDFLDDVFGICPEPTACDSTPPDGHVCYIGPSFFLQFEDNSGYPLMGNTGYNRFISPKCAGRMHRDLSFYDYKFKVENRGMSKYVKEKYSYTQPMLITEDETWDFAIKLYQDVVVENGVTLTITGKVRMPIDGKIIVKQGAKLLIDGGIITSAHDLPWAGIEVWGDITHNQFQTDANGNKYQGEIELKNNAIIENAKLAVNLSQPGNSSSYGGMIKAKDATFLNNGQAVHFYPYRNFNSNLPEYTNNYISWFTNCTFELDYHYDNIVQFNNHLEFEGNKGISISGCKFTISNTVTNKIPQYKAIDAYNSSIFVDTYCASNIVPCPNGNRKSSYFSSFFSAIVSNEGHLYVDNAKFTGNAYGIVLNNSHNAYIINSAFTLGSSNDCSVGIYTNYSSGFTIEENNFKEVPFGATGTLYGIVTNNIESSEEIYKNNFNDLDYGSFFQDQTYGTQQNGIGIYCNTNSNNYADFYSKAQQFIEAGSFDLPAGNTFSQNSNNVWHLYQLSCDYFYNQNDPEQIPTHVTGTNIIPTNTENTCASHLNGDDTRVLSAQQQAILEQAYADRYLVYTQTQTLYNDLQDGGNTNQELMSIESAQAADMWALREQLLGHSPHLSLNVLKKTIDRKDILPPTAIFDILKANPDELKTDTLFNYIKAQGNILPDYMLAILRNVANGVTYKTALIKQMRQAKGDYTRICRRIINSIIADEMGTEAQLRAWLDNMHSIAADRQIVASFMREGNYTDALALANMLPDLYNMNANVYQAHQAYIELLEKYKDIALSGRSLFELTAEEKGWFEQHAQDYEGTISGDMAQSTLRGVYGDKEIGYYPNCPTPEAYQPMGAIFTNNINTEKVAEFYGLELQTDPNPATDWVNFTCKLPEHIAQATLSIRNASGQIVKQIYINQVEQQVLWDCRAIPAGTYLCSIKCNDDLIITKKLVISK